MNMESILLLLVCGLVPFTIASSVVLTPKGEFVTNCFTEEDHGHCEYSRVKICGDFYACDMVIKFETPIKRIGYVDGKILVAEGTKTYHIDEYSHKPTHVKKLIPPITEYVDNYGNKYYTGDGTTYVGLNETGKEVEIVTTGEYSSNQLALDNHANRLFILTFKKSDGKEVRAGYLYALTLSSIDKTQDKIYAEKVEGDDSITAMAVQGTFEKLLLGTRTENGSKLIRLNRINVDPCSSKDIHETAIHEIIGEASKKLMMIFEESDSFARKTCVSSKTNLRIETSGSAQLEITKLKEDLNATETKLNKCTSKVFFISKSESGSAVVHHHNDEKKSCKDEVRSIKNTHAHLDDDIDSFLHQKEIECYKNKLREVEESEANLKKQLQEYKRGLEDMMKDPLLKDKFSSYD